MGSLINLLSSWYFSKDALPHWMILIIDALIMLGTAILASVLHNGLSHTVLHLGGVVLACLCYLVFYLVGFRIMHTYSGVIRYSSFVDLARVAVANFIGIALIFAVRHLNMISPALSIDRILVPITWQELLVTFALGTGLMWALRIAVKFIYDMYFVSAKAQRVLIYGVKEGGIAIAKSIRAQRSDFIVVGFVTDDPKDTQHMLLGLPIFLNDSSLSEVLKQRNVSHIMVSPLKTDAMRDKQEMIDMLTSAKVHIMMYSQQEWDGKSDLRHTHLKEVDIEDLLPRNQIEVDIDAISQILHEKRILITGAAGSIGSEIVRQVASFCPTQLVLVDQAETPLHDIRLMMAREFAHIPCETITASITHKTHMETLFSQYKPEYVFHAAAYKHVPMMENNPGEAVVNNICGTRIIADLAVKYGAKKFVMVSTDKAVNPTNVMGCSKRICEMYCQSLDKEMKSKGQGQTQFVTTRFGNVLGSNGSVIPLFKEQIKDGGPLTVTHPDIIRFFMLIPEACRLVLQAGTMGHGGEIYVFDMGKPVKIADLAKRMIYLSGANDVQIKYTGLRDGEKLYEELLNKEENTQPSSHPKIKLATVRELDYADVCREIDRLVEITQQGYVDMDIVRQMKVLVPEFKSKHSKYEALDN